MSKKSLHDRLRLEPLALLDWAGHWLRPAPEPHPDADGHAVLVLPGFMTGDAVMAPMRAHMRSAGFDAHPWLAGINTGPHVDTLSHVVRSIKTHADRTGRSISLVGWSMGGALAVAAAGLAPDETRRVITLGSPLRADPDGTTIRALFETVSGLSAKNPVFRRLLRGHADVPVVSIVAGRDGVIAASNCQPIQSGNVVVVHLPGVRHVALPVHPDALSCVNDFLAHPPRDAPAPKRTARKPGHR